MPRRLKKSPRDIREARRARRAAIERGDDAPPADKDEFRNALARRINRYLGDQRHYWRGCPERVCRRHRACAAPSIRCSNAPVLPRDPEREVRALAELQRALKTASARLQEGEGKSDPGSGVYPPRLPLSRGTRPRA